MTQGLLIILIESVIILLGAGIFFALKTHKKRALTRNKLSSLLKKLSGNQLERKEKLTDIYKGIGVDASQAEKSAQALVEAEIDCVKRFVEIQMNPSGDDIAFFTEAVYELSDEHMRISMLHTENEIPTASPVVSNTSEVDEIAFSDEAESEATGVDDDDIEVSLDIDEPDELAEPKDLSVVSDEEEVSVLADVDASSEQGNDANDQDETTSEPIDEPDKTRDEPS